MFGGAVNRIILELSKLDAPNEACGYITVGGFVVRLPNLSETPTENFRMEGMADNALAWWHSHPGGPFAPSEFDMVQQYASALPWAIAAFTDDREDIFWFGDGVPITKLIGRGFRHGVTDCYALVRDFYKIVHNIELPDFPRSWKWWENDKELFNNGYREAGFVSVNPSEILPGDILLFKIKSPTPNHSGVYLGNDLMLHHMSAKTEYDPNKLSTVESVARFQPYLTTVLRYDRSRIDRTIGQKVWTQF